MSADEPPTKKPRAEESDQDWAVTLDHQTKYGYKRFSITAASAQIEAVPSDNAYIAFKVRPGERGETELHIAVNERIICAVEKIDEFAKQQAVLHARSWFGRSMESEETGAIYKSPLQRDARYSTKLKVCVNDSTAHTLGDGATRTSGQGEILEDLIKRRSGLQGLQMTGQLSPTIWATRKAFGVHFCCLSLNLTERTRTESDTMQVERLAQLFR